MRYALLKLLFVIAILLLFGLQGIIFTFIYVSIMAILLASGISKQPGFGFPLVDLPADMLKEVIDLPASIPSEMFVVVLALGALPLVARLLRSAIPSPWSYAKRMLVAAAFVFFCLYLQRISAEASLIACASLFGLGLLWITLTALAPLLPDLRLMESLEVHPTAFTVGLTALGAAIGWPIIEPEGGYPHLYELASLVDHWGRLLPYVLAIGITLLVWHVRAENARIHTRDMVLIGTLFFSVFLVTLNTTWLFIPIPFVIALLLSSVWLFKAQRDLQTLRAYARAAQVDTHQVLRDYVDAYFSRTRTANAIRSLQKDFENGKIELWFSRKRHRNIETTCKSSPPLKVWSNSRSVRQISQDT